MANDNHVHCTKEAEIAGISSDVKTLKRIVMGNGQPGLSVTVPELTANVKELNNTIGTLATGVSGLLKFQENQMGIESGKEQIRKSNRWIIGTLLAIVSALLALIAILLL